MTLELVMVPPTRCPLDIYAEYSDRFQPILLYFSKVAEVSKGIELHCDLHPADTQSESEWKPFVDITSMQSSMSM